MAQNPVSAVRIDRSAVSKVHQAHPELAGEPLSRLIRAGLLMLAGSELAEAIEGSKGNTRGPAPSTDRGRARAAQRAAERETAGAAA